MIHSFTVTFGVKYLTGMVTSVPPYETFSLINFFLFLRQSKIYKNYFKNSNFWGMWPLGHVGHVTYSFINILFISTGIFYDKLCPQILLDRDYCKFPFNQDFLNWDFLQRSWSVYIGFCFIQGSDRFRHLSEFFYYLLQLMQCNIGFFYKKTFLKRSYFYSQRVGLVKQIL